MPILNRSKVLTATYCSCRGSSASSPVPRGKRGLPLFYGARRCASGVDGSPMNDSTNARLTLFQRDDCHLCDLALEVLAAARAPEFDSVFIDGDEALEQRYGVRVPVLRDEAGGVELDWPFDTERVRAFVGAT